MSFGRAPPYTHRYDWGCFTQYGDVGVVIGPNGSYRTAFFEAFPDDNAGGFIRGEGVNIEDAEEVCYDKYLRQVSCQHRWGRKQYTNGGAICHKCGAFRTLFKSIVMLGSWRKPLSWMEDAYVKLEDDVEEGRNSYLTRSTDPAAIKNLKRLRARKKLFGAEPRPAAPSSFPLAFKDDSVTLH